MASVLLTLVALSVIFLSVNSSPTSSFVKPRLRFDKAYVTSLLREEKPYLLTRANECVYELVGDTIEGAVSLKLSGNGKKIFETAGSVTVDGRKKEPSSIIVEEDGELIITKDAKTGKLMFVSGDGIDLVPLGKDGLLVDIAPKNENESGAVDDMPVDSILVPPGLLRNEFSQESLSDSLKQINFPCEPADPSRVAQLTYSIDAQFCANYNNDPIIVEERVLSWSVIASSAYEQASCLVLKPEVIEINCDPATDPYRNLTNKSSTEVIYGYRDLWAPRSDFLDAAIFLTGGQDGTGTLGSAFLGAACVHPYNIGWMETNFIQPLVLAHELGHIFNMNHDTTTRNVMNPSLSSNTPFFFSDFSASEMKSFLTTARAECIDRLIDVEPESPTPKSSESPFEEPSRSNTPTPDPSESSQPKPSTSSSPEIEPSRSSSPTPKPSQSSTPAPSRSSTPKPSQSSAPAPSRSSTPKPSQSSTPAPSRSSTPKPSQSSTPAPSRPGTPKPSKSSTITPAISNTSTSIPSGSSIPKPSSSHTPKPKPSESSTSRPYESIKPDPSESSSAKPYVSMTYDPEPSALSTSRPSASNTLKPEPSKSSTLNPFPSKSRKPESSNIFSPKPDPSSSSSPSPKYNKTIDPDNPTDPTDPIDDPDDPGHDDPMSCGDSAVKIGCTNGKILARFAFSGLRRKNLKIYGGLQCGKLNLNIWAPRRIKRAKGALDLVMVDYGSGPKTYFLSNLTSNFKKTIDINNMPVAKGKTDCCNKMVTVSILVEANRNYPSGPFVAQGNLQLKIPCTRRSYRKCRCQNNQVRS